MSPVGVAVDANQTVYIPSSAGNCIYLVSSGGSTSQVVGMGSRGYGGDGGPAASALLSGPLSVALDSQGNNLYIADSFNNVIRKVTINGGTITTITTVAGNGTQGSGGNGGAATSAQLNYPEAVAVDSAGNIYIADTHNNVIREVSGGTINTVAPPGVTFSAPAAVAVNGLDLYIADTGNSVIWELSDSGWSVVAGISGKPGFNGDTTATNSITPTSAQLNQPSGVAVDGLGNIYIGDTYNERIRKVSVATNTIETVAGNGNYGHTGYGGGGPATSATLAGPAGVALEANNIRSERESDKVGVLRGFHDSAYSEEFEVAYRQSLGLEQQVTQVGVAAPAIDEHPDVAIDGFHHTHPDLGPAVVRDAVQVLQ
jgi:hypothetical protein